MKILAIETSCDETAVTILEGHGDAQATDFRILGNALLSQIDIHREFGGVFPAVAKREHAKNLTAMLHAALTDAQMLKERETTVARDTLESVEIQPDTTTLAELEDILTREPELFASLRDFLAQYQTPDIDAIAVTHGPGLAPALWVGVNFARALARAWHKPVVGINHMEGHLLSALAVSDPADSRNFSIRDIAPPVLGLLISGGHTEFVSMDSWLSYRLIGRTRDDAVGEAYDKVARMLGLPYPGGPEISRLAEQARARNNETIPDLPRPMLTDGTCDFSFSGLKTAVRYLIADRTLTDTEREEIAHAFEEAVAEVLIRKTSRALEETGARTLALGGGVSANTNIKRVFAAHIATKHPDVSLRIPEARFTTDNAIMIAIAGFYRAQAGTFNDPTTLRADGNLKLAAHTST